MKRIKIHIARGIGHTNVSFDAPAEKGDEAVRLAKELLAASVPSHGPDMDRM
jgi:hypothetical protein